MQFVTQATPEIPTLTPIRDDTPNTDTSFDQAPKGAFNLTRLERMVADCDNQPDWRPRADLAAAFVDGKQFSAAQQEALIDEGMPDVRPTNLIGRVIRSICGTEAKARTDIKVEVDDSDMDDVADVMNVCMKEAQRETNADMAVSEGYFGQITTGIGWVEVGTATDPLDYPDRVQAVHRSEMWWDMKAKDMVTSSDGRWQCRKRWADLDELEASMPNHRDLLRQVSNGWAGFLFDTTMDDDTRSTVGGLSMEHHFSDERRWGAYRRRSDWYDSTRKRVKLYEIWYKTPAYGIILHVGPSSRLLYDKQNPVHVAAVASGKVKVTKELTTQVRMSLFAGPHRLQDIGTTRRRFPFVPFFAYRDDEDLSPYGLVEGMMSPQMEYNARRIRINWLLRARQIILDNDALDTKANTLKEVADQVMRPDMTVVLKGERANKSESAFRVGNALELQKEQIEVMQDAKQLIQDVPGVYGSQLGQAASGVTSGIANSLLIEQGATAMGDLNDNYRSSRKLVFELLLDNIVNRHLTMNLAVMIGRGSSRRQVILNQVDKASGTIVNNVADAPIRVGLGEVPSSPAFRMQQQAQIATIIGALQANPAAVNVLSPTFIEATDIPNRMELADDLRRASGMPTTGDKAAQQKQQVEQEAELAMQKQMKQNMDQLTLVGASKKIELMDSQTGLNKAKTFEIGHGAGLAQAEAEHQYQYPDDDTEGTSAKADQAKQDSIDAAMKEALGGSAGSPPVRGGQQQPQLPVPGSQAAAMA